MRKLFIILIPLLPFIAKSQLLNNVDAFAAYSNPYAQLVVVKDSLRGGQFLPYSGTDAADNGIIFADALSRKWKRQLGSGNVVSATWYGLSTTASISTSTNYDAFMGALNYIVTHRLSSDLIIPVGTYNFNQTITIDTSISIKGVGNFYDWKTIFVFPENTTGFRLKTKEGGLLNTVVDIADLELRGNANYSNPGTLTLDSSKHAFDISCIVHFNEVHVYGWSGNGFNINACSTPAASNFGNSDNSYFTYCGADLCDNGIYLNGCDANIISIHGSSFTLNRRFNIRDNGFLGNNYQKNHLAYGGVYKTFCTALYSGVYYAAINADTLLNVNKRPDLNPTYWAVIDFVPFTVNTWSNSVRYWQGGSILIENANNYSLALGEYIEAGQPPVRNRGRSLAIGGDNGSGMAEGAWVYQNAGWVYIQNAGLVTENLNTTGTVTINGQSGIPVLNTSGELSSITGTASQILRRNAANTAYEFATIAAGGVTQSALDDTAANIRSTVTTGLATKQNSLGFTPVANTVTVNGHALNANVTVTASDVSLGNVTNESKATMFTNAAFTGTTTGITAAMVGLGNVTNESKATMFTNATFTGTFAVAAGSIANAALANSAVANLSGTNTGDQTTVSGNAGTATTLETARKINGVSFNGSADIQTDLTIAAYLAGGSPWLAQTMDVPFISANTSTALVDNTVRFVPIYLSKAATLTGIRVYVRTLGNYTGDNNNRVGLYSYSGGTMTLVASSTNSASLWTSTANAFQTIPFTSTYAANAGLYFVGLLYNQSAQTTAPTLAGAIAFNNVAMVTYQGTNSIKFFGTLAAQNDLPSSQAMSGVTGVTASYWVALY